ncbi:MAG: hypothetical protein WB507_06260 [Solirubrobacterales bacterium]
MTEVQLDLDALKREGTEVARYRVSSGERIVVGRRGPDGAEIVDVPAAGVGRAFHVDRGYREALALSAFVKDYLAQAARLDACPMSREAIGALLNQGDEDLYGVLLEAL